MSPTPQERRASEETPLPPQVSAHFRASYHIQNTSSYDNFSTKRYAPPRGNRKERSSFVRLYYQFHTRLCLPLRTREGLQRKRRCLHKLVPSLGRHTISKTPPHMTISALKGTPTIWCAGIPWMR